MPDNKAVSRNEPGNPSLRKTVWWAREDSNLQPSGYEPLALTIELRARAGRVGGMAWSLTIPSIMPSARQNET
jgi:hypothetical protein